MRNVATLILLLGIISYGGGGGGDGPDAGGDDPFFAGSWRGSVVLVRNTCPRGVECAGACWRARSTCGPSSGCG
jgi:hypothetical protein